MSTEAGLRQWEAHLQLLGVRGESSHFPHCLGPPEDEGQAAQLACHAGDVDALQGVEADLPRLHGHCQPAVPARDGAVCKCPRKEQKPLRGGCAAGRAGLGWGRELLRPWLPPACLLGSPWAGLRVHLSLHLGLVPGSAHGMKESLGLPSASEQLWGGGCTQGGGAGGHRSEHWAVPAPLPELHDCVAEQGR